VTRAFDCNPTSIAEFCPACASNVITVFDLCDLPLTARTLHRAISYDSCGCCVHLELDAPLQRFLLLASQFSMGCPAADAARLVMTLRAFEKWGYN